MATTDKTQSSPPSTASTVALENLAESVARGTMRALDERQLANASPINLPIGPGGGAVLGIYIPCWEREHKPVGDLNPCHPMIFGIIIMPGLHPIQPVPPVDPPK
jgi:hypothetical protein